MLYHERQKRDSSEHEAPFEPDNSQTHNKIYNASTRLNERIKKYAGIGDIIDVKTYKIRVDPKYTVPKVEPTDLIDTE